MRSSNSEVFEVIKPGPLTTVQDQGRYGYQHYGVPVAGAMDGFALRVANFLADNREDAACLEITLMGLKLRVLANTIIAVTGGDLAPRINGDPLTMWQSVAVTKGDVISFAWARKGCRTYLSVAGGIDVPPVMGSRATYVKSGIGGFEGRALKSGDRLKNGIFNQLKPGLKLPPEFTPLYKTSNTLRVILGPQDDYFTGEGIQTLLNSEYTISNEADRVGYRLIGPVIKHKAGADIISDGIPMGAIQVPGSGLPIVLLADRQTTGGYPKIATAVTVDIPRLGQAKPGDKLRLKSVTISEARVLLQEYEDMLSTIKDLLLKGG